MHSCKVQLLAPLWKKVPESFFPDPMRRANSYSRPLCARLIVNIYVQTEFPFPCSGGNAEDKEKEGDWITLSPMCFSITTSVRNSENSSRGLCPCLRAKGENLVDWSCSCLVREECRLGWRKQGVERRGDSGWLLLVNSIRNKTLVRVIIAKGMTWPRKLTLKLCASSPKLLP